MDNIQKNFYNNLKVKYNINYNETHNNIIKIHKKICIIYKIFVLHFLLKNSDTFFSENKLFYFSLLFFFSQMKLCFKEGSNQIGSELIKLLLVGL